MPFPISSSGIIKVQLSETENLLPIIRAVEKAIRDAKPTKLITHENELSFHAGIFRFVDNSNQLVSISSGQIWFSRQGELVLMHYRISFVQLLILVSLIIGLVFGFLVKATVERGILGWLWLFGANYLVTLYRFPRFLRAAAESARNNKEPSD